MNKILIKEKLNRIKELMGLLIEDIGNDNCYPSDYELDRLYERDDFFPSYDPKNINWVYEKFG